MDDSIPDPGTGAYTEITVRIPDELARLIGAGGEVERRVLEALALDEFHLGHLSRAELRRLLGFGMRMKLDEFLAALGVFGAYTVDNREREAKAWPRSSPTMRVAPVPVGPQPTSLPGGLPSRT